MDKNAFENNDTYKAWCAFLNEGVISQESIKAEIMASWQRSRNIDPYSKLHHQLPQRILQSKQAENVQLLSWARPIMQELAEIAGLDFLALADSEGYVIEIAGDSKFQGLLGLRFNEQDVGTNAIGTTLLEGKALEVKGSEHYCRCYHSTYGAAVPVHNRKDCIIGVLAVYNLSRPLPAGILQTLKMGVKVIENHFDYKSEQSQTIRIYHNTCSSIIDIFQEGVLVVDAQENIININQSALNMLGINDRASLIGKFFGNLLADNNWVLANLLSKSPNEYVNRFSLRGGDGIVPCSLIRRRVARNQDGSHQTILSFIVEGAKMEVGSQFFGETYNEDISGMNNLIGHSEKWNEIKKLAARAARVSSSVLIEGESGTGKELVAHAIHEKSGLQGPFVAINCGAIPKELLQSELFGYEEGSFTGARKGGGLGKLEMGDGGTVFLDEIGEMPFDMQVNLLRFLQDKMITRIGSSTPRKVDVRIIAATNRKLKNEVKMGRFREDLFYRLNVISIEIPPLRERKLDIPPMTRFFIQTLCRQFGQGLLSISDAAMHRLCAYDWPGNARELRNVIENAVVFTEGSIISEDILPPFLREKTKPVDPVIVEKSKAETFVPDANMRGLSIEEARKLNQKLSEDSERDEILRLLDHYRGNISRVALHLGASRSTIYRKMKNYKIET